MNKSIAQRNRKLLNKPIPSTRRGKKYMVYVRNTKTGRVKTIHFGDINYRQNSSKMSHDKFLKRSAGIRDKKGKLTKDNPLSANYWTRRFLWSNKKWAK